jgi:drug/metabolite transporter (DMT)-like permease
MNRFLGTLLIIISAAGFGTLAIFGRLAYASGMDVFTLLFLRFTIAAICMAVMLRMRGEQFPQGKIFWQLVGMGAIGYVGQSYTYLSAVKYASAGLVALLLYLYPVIVAALSAIFLKERFTRWKIIALALALAGTALTARPEGGGWLGIALALAAAFIYSGYIIVGAGVMKHVSAFQSSTIIFTAAGMVYAGLAALNGPHPPQSTFGWSVVIGTVIFATIVPVSTFLGGLKLVGPTNASMLSTLEPVVTVILAAMLFGETLSPLALLGGGLILAAVILLTWTETSS